MRHIILTLSLGLLFIGSPAFGQTSPEEQRAREIGTQLRCVVCQNQSIEESDAQLAQDMRLVVREQIANGASNKDVIEYMRSSYGDYVLLKPPFQPNTYFLWLLPAGLILFILSWFGMNARRKVTAVVTEPRPTLSADDQNLLDELLRDET